MKAEERRHRRKGNSSQSPFLGRRREDETVDSARGGWAVRSRWEGFFSRLFEDGFKKERIAMLLMVKIMSTRHNINEN